MARRHVRPKVIRDSSVKWAEEKFGKKYGSPKPYGEPCPLCDARRSDKQAMRTHMKWEHDL